MFPSKSYKLHNSISLFLFFLENRWIGSLSKVLQLKSKEIKIKKIKRLLVQTAL